MQKNLKNLKNKKINTNDMKKNSIRRYIELQE